MKKEEKKRSERDRSRVGSENKKRTKNNKEGKREVSTLKFVFFWF